MSSVFHNPYDTSPINKQRQQEFLNSFVRPVDTTTAAMSSPAMVVSSNSFTKPIHQEDYLHVHVPNVTTATQYTNPPPPAKKYKEYNNDVHSSSRHHNTNHHHHRPHHNSSHDRHDKSRSSSSSRSNHYHHSSRDRHDKGRSSSSSSSSDRSDDGDYYSSYPAASYQAQPPPPPAMIYQLIQNPDARLFVPRATVAATAVASAEQLSSNSVIPPSPAVVVRSKNLNNPTSDLVRAGRTEIPGGILGARGMATLPASTYRSAKSTIDLSTTLHAVDANTMQWTRIGDETIMYVTGRALRLATQIGHRYNINQSRKDSALDSQFSGNNDGSSSTQMAAVTTSLYIADEKGLVELTKMLVELNEVETGSSSSIGDEIQPNATFSSPELDQKKQQVGIEILNSKYMSAHREMMSTLRGFDEICADLLASDAPVRSTSARLALSAVIGAHKALMVWAQVFANSKSAWIADLRESTTNAILGLVEGENRIILDATSRAKHIVTSSADYANRLQQYFRPMTSAEMAFTQAGLLEGGSVGHHSSSFTMDEEDRVYIDSTFAEYTTYLANIQSQTAQIYPQISILAAASISALGEGEKSDRRTAEALVVVIGDMQDALEAAVQQLQQITRRRGSVTPAGGESIRVFLEQRSKYAAAVRREQEAMEQARKAGEQLIMGWRTATSVQTLDKLHGERVIALARWKDAKDSVVQFQKLLSTNESQVGSSKNDSSPQHLLFALKNNASTSADSTPHEIITSSTTPPSLLESIWIFHHNVFHTRLDRLRQLSTGYGGGFGDRMLSGERMPIDSTLFYSIKEMIEQSKSEALASLRTETVRKVDFVHKQSEATYKKKIASLKVTCVELDRLLIQRKKTLENVLIEQKLRLVTVYDITQKEYGEMERTAQYFGILAMRTAIAMQTPINLRQASLLYTAVNNILSSESWQPLKQ